MSVSFPVDRILPDLLTALEQQGGAILQAPPGAGKSTRVPQALLSTPWASDKRILVLQPRRMAARALAEFVAGQLGEPVGQTVGYRTGLESKYSAQTRLEFITEGILPRLLQSDPELDGVAAVVFDEFHLRSLSADLGLALIEEVRGALRDDLRLLVMSATLALEPLAALLALPVITSEGRSFPVSVRYQPPGQLPWQQHCVNQIIEQHRQLADPQAVILVFLPGRGEIDRVQRNLAGQGLSAVQPLHGGLSPQQQQEVLAAAAAGQCRVVLSTNVAETSITLEGVRCVIDSGLARVPLYDPGTHRSRLVTRRISRASAQQRSGRAGRLGPGDCLRLWSELESLAAQTPAEMTQVGLDGLVLDLALWGCRDRRQLCWLDEPPEGAWQAACQRLRDDGALDGQGAVTPLGKQLGRLAVEPQKGRLVLAGRAHGLARSAALVAAMLSERDILGPAAGADLSARLKLLYRSPKQYSQLWRQVDKLSGGQIDQHPWQGSLAALLAQVYPDSIARQRPGKPGSYQLAAGPGVVLAADDGLASSPWLVVLDTNGEPRDARIRLAMALNEADLSEALAQFSAQRERVGWDRDRQRVSAWREHTLGALCLSRQPLENPEPRLVEQGLLAGLREEGLSLLPWTPALRQWQARVALMADLEPQQWPRVDDSQLLASLEQWLLPYLAGMRGVKDLQQVALSQALHGLLDNNQQQRLQQALPTTIQVPSGRQVSLDYTLEGGPVLAVKLQELFGLAQLPVLAEGRCRIRAHLLTPAGRPAAITDDLRRFWGEGYAQVRKDLRGRYPKHPWPQDPLTAQATALTKGGLNKRC